jgi:exodeoxyribonuclease V alpha subunit
MSAATTPGTEAPRTLDVHFGRALAGWARPVPSAADAALLEAVGTTLSAALGAQAACVGLDALAASLGLEGAALAQRLDAHGLLRSEHAPAPLVLDGGSLYLARVFDAESAVAEALSRRAAAPPRMDPARRGAFASRLRDLFPDEADGAVNWQRVAAAMALERGLAVITGGPGTGKTTTVTRLLVLLAEQAEGPLRIRLAAPTGKAAARLTESVRESRQRLVEAGACDADALDALPDAAETLHRLLGYRALANDFRHGPGAPVAADVVVVDEASMIDLRLMAQLLSALAPDTRLVLLGDRDQLSSVEAGQVLGDLCAWTETHFETRRWSTGAAAALGTLTGEDLAPLAADDVPPLADALCLLQRSHRFDAASPMGRFAAAVNAGDVGGALEAFAAQEGGLAWVATEDAEALATAARDGCRDALRLAATPGADPRAALAALGRFQVLCATRSGPFGVERLNAAVEAGFRREGLIPPGDGPAWPGRPVMITVNDYGLGLFNGDVGVLLDDGDGHLRAWFLAPDRSLRSVRPTRLPRHETVFAMTVHKSQGSEFDRVLVALPPEPGENERRLLTREMLYTAVTRARAAVAVHAPRAVLADAIERRTVRASGLRRRLWGDEVT